MKQVNIGRALIGGFVGTLVLTALMYLAPFVGAPRLDIAAALGSMLGNGVPAMMTGVWWLGMVWHFLNGTVLFSLIYAYFVYSWLPGDGWLRGLIWGVALWIGMELVLMPAIGSGVFSDHTSIPIERIAVGFVLNLAYGLLLGLFAGAQAEHAHQAPHPVS